MNIQNKLAQLRKAKKLRPILVYGLADQPGIDVADSDYPNVEAFLKNLFRVLKKEGFDILINHWGAIFLIEPDRQIPVALSINKTIEPFLSSDCQERLKASSYFEFGSSDAKGYLSKLVVSYRAWRPGTKWRFVLLDNDEKFIVTLLDEMKARVSSLVSSPRHSLSMNDEVTLEDVAALLLYSYIKTYGSDQTPAWIQEISTSWGSCEIFDGSINFSSRGIITSYPLLKSDIALLKKILPNISDERVVIKSKVGR